MYLYNSNDDDNPADGGYEMKSIVCISSADLKNWTDHGEVFRVPAGASWAGYSWAPYTLEKGGQFYLYFGNNAGGVGVASSTTPTGEFKDAKGSALINGSTPGAAGTNSWLFDPGALIDDDGQAYLAFGGNGETNARIIKLGADLVSVSGSAAALAPQGLFRSVVPVQAQRCLLLRVLDEYRERPAHRLHDEQQPDDWLHVQGHPRGPTTVEQ
ncbi:MAG: family 43 glycosylhydrolase [Polyangiaceae bacterium]